MNRVIVLSLTVQEAMLHVCGSGADVEGLDKGF